jgi:hypothetical protein
MAAFRSLGASLRLNQTAPNRSNRPVPTLRQSPGSARSAVGRRGQGLSGAQPGPKGSPTFDPASLSCRQILDPESVDDEQHLGLLLLGPC